MPELRPPHFIVVDGNMTQLYNVLEVHGSLIIHSGGQCERKRAALYLLFPEHVAWCIMRRHSRNAVVRMLELHQLNSETQVRRIVDGYLRDEKFMREVQESCGSVTIDLPEDLHSFAEEVISWIGNELTHEAIVTTA